MITAGCRSSRRGVDRAAERRAAARSPCRGELPPSRQGIEGAPCTSARSCSTRRAVTLRGVSSPIRVLLTGATGYLGRYLVEQSRAPARPGEPGLEVRTAGRAGCDHAVDLAVRSAIAPLVDAVRPDVVLHAGAVSSIAACEAAPGIAQAVNVHATAELCARAPAVVYVSTDLVFGGDRAPYGVRDPVRPLSVYGRSKAAGEEAVLASARGVVVRVPLLFGRSFDGRRGATDMIRAAAADDREVTLFVDEFRTPLHVADAAALLLSLCRVVGAGGDAPRIVHA